MAKRRGRRKCKSCHEFFIPDPRNKKKQRFCSKPECRKASKAASQARWLSKKENRNYFRGPENVVRVQEWRRQNPGYCRSRGSSPDKTLQDHSTAESAENRGVAKHLAPDALQDLLTSQHAVLVGLIASFSANTLQDDIVKTTRRLQQLGSDILNSSPLYQGGVYDSQNSYLSPSGPPSS